MRCKPAAVPLANTCWRFGLGAVVADLVYDIEERSGAGRFAAVSKPITVTPGGLCSLCGVGQGLPCRDDRPDDVRVAGAAADLAAELVTNGFGVGGGHPQQDVACHH